MFSAKSGSLRTRLRGDKRSSTPKQRRRIVLTWREGASDWRIDLAEKKY